MIVGKLETFRASAHIDPGHFNALIAHLETALAALENEQNQVVRQALTAFISLVDSLDGSALSAPDASAHGRAVGVDTPREPNLGHGHAAVPAVYARGRVLPLRRHG